MPIRKAVIPVAGLGTRFLPATKAQPKEMLTIVDKPAIQYVVEDAVAAGIEEIIFVTSQQKRAIEDHFDRNAELEARLESKGKTKELTDLLKISNLAKFAFVRQAVPLGDGHAILSALPFVGTDEPVAVLFGDNLFEAKKSITAQMVATYDRYGDSVIALSDVGRKNVSKYGIASGKMLNKSLMELSGFVEKPSPEKAPSTLAAVGCYVVTPDVLNILKTQQATSKDGEIRLADAFATHLKSNKPIYGMVIDGHWFDVGSKLGFMQASVHFALKHEEANADGAFARYLKSVTTKSSKR
jgi:UTP--glucose-1-phosphate uridylyltransferase